MASDDATGQKSGSVRPVRREPSPPSARGEPGAGRLGSSSGGERPLSAQAVIAGVLALVLLAVPLYLLRRPTTRSAAPLTPPTAPSASSFGGVVRDEPAADAGTRSSAVTLGPVQRVRCGSSPRTLVAEGSLCDALPPLERALARAIEQNVECAPRTGKGGTLNYVLEVDFDRRHLGMFAGQSGSWKGPQARTAARCVLRQLPPVDWDRIDHQYRYYAIAIMGTYPAPDPLEELPVFD